MGNGFYWTIFDFDQFKMDNSIVSVKLMDFGITLQKFTAVPQPPVIATKTFINEYFSIAR